MIENVENPVTEVTHFPGADEMHRELLRNLDSNFRRLIQSQNDIGKETIRLDAGAVAASQHIRFRVRWIIISRATVGDATLLVGTGSYVWTVGAVPVRIDFPILIDRGVDMQFVGDGRIYLIGDPE